MKIHYYATVISVAFFVLWACTTQENKPNADPAGYEPTTSQDISFLDINDFAEDSLGYMWIATL